MKKIVLLHIIIVFISSCKSPDTILLKDLSFTNSIFSGIKTDSLHTYCLLASGYFRAPSSKNSDSLITQWILQHPNAKVVSVATHGPTMTDYPDSKMTYCWLIDKKDTINNFLIKNGCYPGGTMTLSTFKELADNQILHITKKEYENFIQQIITAEEFARLNKLGIWAKQNDEEE
ncbi:MAG: hypothetical protein J0I84_21230 [Terrimonas sp.]|nr:hypothetical protein [Terrimonas sp.]OJY92112.1 MAG: hypothetical protein BGP13_08050 [Sphingobacteriales bacterium 40-81]